MKKMMKPCFYFPTTVMMVDDNLSFLSNLQLSLAQHVPVLLNNDPEAALQKISEERQLSERMGDFTVELDEEDLIPSLDSEAISIDWHSIGSLVYDDTRFNNVSAVLIDYNMPSMNGLDFCRKIKDKKVKKIMVTGAADHELAVKAFNEGLIDKFVLKDQDNFFKELSGILQDAQREFFMSLSDKIIQSFSKNTITKSPEYVELFAKFLQDYGIVEYYMVDHYGSYLCLDEQGEIIWFIMVSDKKMEEYLDVAIGNHAADEVVQKIGAKTHLPFLYSDLDKRLPVSEWKSYLFPVEGTIITNQKHYYAIIKDRNFQIRSEKIKTFRGYLADYQTQVAAS